MFETDYRARKNITHMGAASVLDLYLVFFKEPEHLKLAFALLRDVDTYRSELKDKKISYLLFLFMRKNIIKAKRNPPKAPYAMASTSVLDSIIRLLGNIFCIS